MYIFLFCSKLVFIFPKIEYWKSKRFHGFSWNSCELTHGVILQQGHYETKKDFRILLGYHNRFALLLFVYIISFYFWLCEMKVQLVSYKPYQKLLTWIKERMILKLLSWSIVISYIYLSSMQLKYLGSTEANRSVCYHDQNNRG